MALRSSGDVTTKRRKVEQSDRDIIKAKLLNHQFLEFCKASLDVPSSEKDDKDGEVKLSWIGGDDDFFDHPNNLYLTSHQIVHTLNISREDLKEMIDSLAVAKAQDVPLELKKLLVKEKEKIEKMAKGVEWLAGEIKDHGVLQEIGEGDSAGTIGGSQKYWKQIFTDDEEFAEELAEFVAELKKDEKRIINGRGHGDGTAGMKSFVKSAFRLNRLTINRLCTYDIKSSTCYYGFHHGRDQKIEGFKSSYNISVNDDGMMYKNVWISGPSSRGREIVVRPGKGLCTIGHALPQDEKDPSLQIDPADDTRIYRWREFRKADNERIEASLYSAVHTISMPVDTFLRIYSRVTADE
jgi:dihydroxyacetone kinase DhaKLM complex PTS-EIIA-like component DhaM